jgi:hypothetical protein
MSGTPLSRLSMQHDSPQPYQECLLQEVIDRFPNILPICDYYPHTAGLCSLGREIPVPVADDKEGCIDNLLVTDEGHLVIVETKLWRNPEAVRKVIAQTLQYCMAVSQLMLSDFEGCLRRGDPSGERLGKDETVFEHVRSQAAGGSLPPAGIPMTEDELTKQIQADNSAELAGLAETLRSRLKSSGLATRRLPSGIQYGVDVAGDFTPLVTLTARALWFQIPMRAVRQLGDTRFAACKQQINSVGNFYRREEVDDPTKTNALGPKSRRKCRPNARKCCAIDRERQPDSIAHGKDRKL